MRGDISYRDYVKTNMELRDCDDMRDSRGVEAGATGLLKIIFPDKAPSETEFYQFCVNPALEMRQRVRDELCKLDREYAAVTFKSKIPDEFQRNHHPSSYVDEKELVNLPLIHSAADTLQPADQEEAELLKYFGENKVPDGETTPLLPSEEKEQKSSPEAL